MRIESGTLMRDDGHSNEFVTILGFDEHGQPICRRNATGQIGIVTETYRDAHYNVGVIHFPALSDTTRDQEAS